MDGTDPACWLELNQKYIAAALARLKALLEASAAGTTLSLGDRESGIAKQVAHSMDAPPALEALTSAFGLSAFESDLLLLCAGVELDAGFARLCAAAQRDQRRCATFGLALAALPHPHWSAFSPAAPLRYWRLIELTPGETLIGSALRIDERVLHYLTGVDAFDDRLAGFEEFPPGHDLPDSQAALAETAARAWQLAMASGSPLPVVQLFGADAATRRAIFGRAAMLSGLKPRVVRAGMLPQNVIELDNLVRLWRRETRLAAGALLLECDDDAGDAESGGQRSIVAQVAELMSGAVIIAAPYRRDSIGRPMINLPVTMPTAAEQCALWRAALRGSPLQSESWIAALVDQFQLSPRAIQAAANQALATFDAAASAPDRVPAALWDACRAQTRPRLTNLTQQVDAAAGWNDLVLPEPQLALLRDIVIQVRHRSAVHEGWGFSGKGARGLGISALFAGPSGTGKTMAGEVLARELRLDLYRVDLSQVVSKYIGETEKNLRQIFDAAEHGSAILLFDEADALFGKRSDVKDSHDRYANIEVSYLLQRMEAYRGLAVLTTNLRGAIDTAFLRRIRFVVQFPFPDAIQRERIWNNIFPNATPTEGLRPELLARLNVSGGSIRNIALGGAFLAAAEGQPVRMAHLLQAASNECLKIEKTIAENEIRGWV
jgi:hypothetical protein